MEATLAIAALLILVIANGFATRLALRDRYAERHQKIFQCLAIWLVPVVGEILVFGMHRNPEKSTGRYPESPSPVDDFADGKRVGRGISTHADD